MPTLTPKTIEIYNADQAEFILMDEFAPSRLKTIQTLIIKPLFIKLDYEPIDFYRLIGDPCFCFLDTLIKNKEFRDEFSKWIDTKNNIKFQTGHTFRRLVYNSSNLILPNEMIFGYLKKYLEIIR